MGYLSSKVPVLVVLVMLICLCLPACSAVEAISVVPGPFIQEQGGQERGHFYETKMMAGSREGLSYSIWYPYFSVAAVDNDVMSWITEAIDNTCVTDTESMGTTLPQSSLTVEYQVSEMADGISRLDFTGVYIESEGGENGEELLESFCIDWDDHRLIPFDKLMYHDQIAGLLKMQHPEWEKYITDKLYYTINALVQNDNILLQFMICADDEEQIVTLEISHAIWENIIREENQDLDVSMPETQEGEESTSAWRAREIDPNLPMIALTFDDGPSVFTKDILDLMEEYQVRATFFMIGSQIDWYHSALVRMVELGCEPSNHTWDHKMKLTKRSPEEIAWQIQNTIDKIEEVTGLRSTLVRPPYGEVDDTVKEVARDLGVTLVNWSVDPLDWKTKDVDAICKEVLGKVKNGSIILLHDLYEPTVEAVSLLIPQLLEQGYQLVTVSELFEYSSREIVAGELYRHQ